MRRAAPILLSIAMVACAYTEPAPIYWYKKGGTQHEFDRTSARCRMGADSAPVWHPYRNTNTAGGSVEAAGDNLSDAGRSLQYFDDCMRSQGWYTRR